MSSRDISGLALPEERPDALDHAARALRLADDLRDGVQGLIDVGSLAGQPPHRGAGIGRDGGKRLIHLVRDRGAHLAQRRDAAGMSKLRLRIAQRLLGLARFGHVHECADDFLHRSVCHAVRANVEVFDVAVSRQPAVLIFEMLGALHGAIDDPLHDTAIVGVNVPQDQVDGRRDGAVDP